ncbi:hypothetical protein O0L34_g2322 [Tuta absoluta]|nr:hypothetical protein O0L34_g2322 [Tuta absoluta]
MVRNTSTRYVISKLCIFIFIIPQSYQNRKYDVEAECLKLYKENFDTVLARFRRSPDYVKVLEAKSLDFDSYVDDVKTHIAFFYYDGLEKKISELAGTERKLDKAADDVAVEDPSNRRQEKVFRRGQDDQVANKSMLERLDSYHKLSSTMTVSQRNAMKDLGFQFAGHVIHALIKNMGKDTSEDGMSTNLDSPSGSTTEHVSVHTVGTTAKDDNQKADGASGEKAAARSASVQKRFQKKGFT